MQQFQYIEYTIKDNVATIRLNQPDSLNALSVEMGAELSQALDDANANARALILTSAGRGFCSGANLMTGTINPVSYTHLTLPTIYSV